MSESKHTPTPWMTSPYNAMGVFDSDKRCVAVVYSGVHSYDIDLGEREANAAFIVKAVNAYEPMVEALLCILREAKNPESFKYDLQAIASNMLSAIGRHPDSVQP